MTRLLAALLGLIAALGLSAAGLAIAGGWAVVKLDGLPTDVTAGKSISVGFTVLQHGVNPISGIKPIVHAGHATSGEKVEVPALDQGEPGHYVADFTFPSSGTWNWSIDAFGADHVMPPLEVLPVEVLPPIAAQPPQAADTNVIAVEREAIVDSTIIEKSANAGESSTAAESISVDPVASDFESATASGDMSAQRRLALGLGAAGLAILVAGAMGAWVMRRAPVPARG